MPIGEHSRRDRHSLTFNEYTIRNPPYGPGFEKSKHLHSYVGSTDYVKNIVVDERENPFTGTNYAWVRARCLGGKTNIWGRLSLRLSDYDFKAKSRDGYGEDWPISYSDLAPYYDKVDLYLGHHRREGKPSLSSRRHISASHQTELRRDYPEARHAEDGPGPDPVPRGRHHRRIEAQPVSQPLLWTWRL